MTYCTRPKPEFGARKYLFAFVPCVRCEIDGYQLDIYLQEKQATDRLIKHQQDPGSEATAGAVKLVQIVPDVSVIDP
jgi:hypothetical protein